MVATLYNSEPASFLAVDAQYCVAAAAVDSSL
jgi:hypothetical protein